MGNRCLYSNSLDNFIREETDSTLGKLCDGFLGVLITTQIEAWKSEIEALKPALACYVGEDAQIVFEYDIPRLGKRIDAVLLLRGIIFCLEFKVGNQE